MEVPFDKTVYPKNIDIITFMLLEYNLFNH